MTLDVSVPVRTGMHIWTGNPGSTAARRPVKLDAADGARARVLLRHSRTMRHDPLDEVMTADPPAVAATKAAV